jgi:hypothetical protein
MWTRSRCLVAGRGTHLARKEAADWEEEATATAAVDWEEEAKDWAAVDWEEEATAAVDSVAAEEAKVVVDWEEEVTDWAEVEKVVDSVAAAEAKAAEVKEATVKLAAETAVAGKEGMAAAKAEGSDRRCPARCRRCRQSTTCRRCPR